MRRPTAVRVCCRARGDTAHTCRFTHRAQVCAHADIHTHTHRHLLAQCVRPDKLLHPFIYPEMCPVSLHASFSSILSPLLSLYKPALLFPPPLSLPAATNHRKPERTEGDIKKEGKQKTAKKKKKRGEGVSGGLSFFPLDKRPVGIHLISVDAGPKNEQPAGQINMEEKWWQ